MKHEETDKEIIIKIPKDMEFFMVYVEDGKVRSIQSDIEMTKFVRELLGE